MVCPELIEKRSFKAYRELRKRKKIPPATKRPKQSKNPKQNNKNKQQKKPKHHIKKLQDITIPAKFRKKKIFLTPLQIPLCLERLTFVLKTLNYYILKTVCVINIIKTWLQTLFQSVGR